MLVLADATRVLAVAEVGEARATLSKLINAVGVAASGAGPRGAPGLAVLGTAVAEAVATVDGLASGAGVVAVAAFATVDGLASGGAVAAVATVDGLAPGSVGAVAPVAGAVGLLVFPVSAVVV